MNNKTKINSSINETIVNPNIAESTVINKDLISDSSKLSVGTIVADKYNIIEPLSVSTGEADLYLCDYNNKKYVAKIYRRQQAIKPEVIDALKSIDSPYVAKLYDAGIYNNVPYEILPYYKNGSLQGKKYSFEDLKQTIIPCINEALHVLHQKDIIHKDLKPSNIMLLDDNKSVAIIDFGISSMVDDGNTILITKTGMTPEYSAPETFKSLFLEESDYYSFGITIFELFCGYTPYKNLSAEEIARFTTVQKIPYPEEMPKKLQNLITAVTYYDITNRNDKNNPNRRWTYDEVKKWCNDKVLPIPGENVKVVRELSVPVYKFLGERYTDVPTLIESLASHWEDGKRQLFRGLLSSYFKNFDAELAGFCMDAEDESSNNSGKEDCIFWNLLYKLNPDLKTFYWLGKSYESLSSLGLEMLYKLWDDDKSDFDYWDSILNNKLLSNYLKYIDFNKKGIVDAMSALESSHCLINNNTRERLMNYYIMAYMLSGQYIYCINKKKFKNINELTSYMKELLDSSYEEFEYFCHKMIDHDDTLDVQFEAWLIALGKHKELEVWKTSLKG
ncbi:MAG: protein kinase [Erysipelotrichaceae bacterium]|nr:protein kinase [Erysipelotrichaceae bacterium]